MPWNYTLIESEWLYGVMHENTETEDDSLEDGMLE